MTTGVSRDPVLFELMQHAVSAVADQMAVTVIRTARSTVSKEAMDFSTGICNADGEVVALGLCLPLMLGSLPPALQTIKREFDGDMHPGDVYAFNDPYDGGAHLPDIYMVKPVFIEGQLTAFSCAVMHHADIGGIASGGLATSSTEIFQEGLRIPPLKLFDKGKANETLFAILEKNVRMPEKVLGDLHSELAAVMEGEKGVAKLVEEQGLETVQWYFRDLLDYTEMRSREAIRALPDGEFTFRDYLDDDGLDPDPLPIQVSLKKQGDELIADFAGSAPAARGAINMTLSYTQACVYAALRCVLDPDIPNNGGFFRPVQVKVEPGSLLYAQSPSPVASRALTAMHTSDAVMGALAQMLPDRVPACGISGDVNVSLAGYHPGGVAFGLLDWVFGSWGGRPKLDGIDHVSSLTGNFSNTPVEVLEAESPVLIEEYAMVPGTEGAGEHRGGLGVVREIRLVGADQAAMHVRIDRHKYPAYGLSGGESGAPTRASVMANDGEQVMTSKFRGVLKRGESVRIQVGGGGGWGDPLQRDPAAVLDDVVNEKVTVERARDVYGVALAGSPAQVDEAGTVALREAMRNR